MKRRTSVLAVVSLVLAIQVGCTDTDLKKAAKALKVLDVAVGELQKNVTTAAEQGLIDASTAQEIRSVCERISAAGTQAGALLAAIEKTAPEKRNELLILLAETSAAVDPKTLELVTGIKNEQTRIKIERGLLLIHAILSSLQVLVSPQINSSAQTSASRLLPSPGSRKSRSAPYPHYWC